MRRVRHERSLFCLPGQERFFPAFRAKNMQIRAKQRPDRASERLHSCCGARFLRLRGKMAGVLLVVLYACKGLRKGSRRWDLNPKPDKNVKIRHRVRIWLRSNIDFQGAFRYNHSVYLCPPRGCAVLRIDVSTDFTLDTPHYWDNFWVDGGGIGVGGADPDSSSKTLQLYHQIIWSRKLPCGKTMELQRGTGTNYLSWDGFRFGSDSIIVSFRYMKYRYPVQLAVITTNPVEATILELGLYINAKCR